MHILRLSLFMTTLTLLLGGSHLYLYRRFFRDTSSSPAVRRAGRLLMSLGGGLIVLRLFLVMMGHPFGRIPSLVLTVWLGLALYLVMTTAGIEAALWLGERVARFRRPSLSLPDAGPASPERRQFLARGVATGALAAASSVSAYGVWRAYQPPVLTHLSLRLPGLPKTLDGFKIVQISDIHIGDVLGQRFLADLVDRCNAQKPDLMAVTGDLVDGPVARLGKTASELGRLKARYGTYFCTGNHDFYSGDLEWCDAIGRMGITVLRNRFVSIGDAGGSFDLIGVDDWGHRQAEARSGRGYNLTRALEGRDPHRASVLLAHQPGSFSETVQAQLGLQLSGHTHGGQLFPNTYLCDLLYPVNAGHGRQGDSHLYVNRGAGFWGPPMRVGSPPEIATITLRA